MRNDKRQLAPRATDDAVFEAATDPHRLARVFVRSYGLKTEGGRLLRFWRDEWWAWAGCRYVVLRDADLRADVTQRVKAELDRWARHANKREEGGKPKAVHAVTRSLISNVMQALQGSVSVSGTFEQPIWLGHRPSGRELLAMRNGLIDIAAAVAAPANVPKVMNHSSDWFSPVCLEYAFDPAATCPQWLTFLDEILESDQQRIRLVQEWFGYCLRFDTTLHRFLVLIGDGANGKSVLLAVLTALLGAQNVSHVPLEFFGERFHLTATLGKLADIVPEFGSPKRIDEGVLKAFVAGDPLYFDRKNLPPVHARPTARLVFATNEVPRFHDRSEGIWRRMIMLPFRVVIPADRQDVHLIEKLQRELPGLFNWSLEGLRRLRRQGRFTEPDLCRAALEDHRQECNVARAFLQERVTPMAGGEIVCGDLDEGHRSWAVEQGVDPVNHRQLGKEVGRLFPTSRRVRRSSGDRPWAYAGICWIANESAAGRAVAAPRLRPVPAARLRSKP